MNKTPRLSKSGIEYLDYVWNFNSGCLNWKNGVCPVENCWAKGITERFKNNYPNGFEPTFYPEAFLSPLSLKKPSIIGCAFMGDLFGDWIEPGKMINVQVVPGLSHAEPLREQVFRTINQCPQHSFLFLTKCPWNLSKWAPFPRNCWVGVTATGYDAFNKALDYLKGIEAKVKFISIEPLLEAIPFYMERLAYCGINQVIIGAQTNPNVFPKIPWVQHIVEAADKARIPVFLKNNLGRLLLYHEPLYWAIDSSGFLRQEMPNGN